jgi:hypothetical protein
MNRLIYFRDDDQILSKISELTEVPEKEIKEFLPELKDCPKGDCAADAYWDLFERTFQVSPTLDGAVYFHGCRVLRNEENPFSDGLLPNNLALDKIWEVLWKATRDHLDFPSPIEMKADYENSTSPFGTGGYDSRLNGKRKREFGPWGKLTRPEWFIPWLNSNHYINCGSELVSLSLQHFAPDRGLHEVYREKTVACLVHFILPEASVRHLGYGLSYLRDIKFCEHRIEYEEFYGLESAEGRIIPKSDILEIERIEQGGGGQPATPSESKISHDYNP